MNSISDHHNMVLTILRSSFKKCPPKIVTYRDYKLFDQISFKEELAEMLNANRVYNYTIFEEIFLSVLNKHAPLKEQKIRGNPVKYMTKTLKKAIVKRTELRTKYLKNSNFINLRTFKKQKNYCTKLYKKERKKYYSNLDINNITDNKKFWKTLKPFLSDKGPQASKITLVQNDQIISDDNALADTFKDFFDNAVKNLNLCGNENIFADGNNGYAD